MMKAISFAFLAVSMMVSGCASSTAMNVKSALTQMNAVKEGKQADGSYVACVSGIQNVSLARSAAANRARAKLAMKGQNAQVDESVETINGVTIRRTFGMAYSSGISIAEYRIKGTGYNRVVCARAKKIEFARQW